MFYESGYASFTNKKMSLCMRKPTIPISDHVWRKPACTVTDAGKRLEILDLESRGTVLSI